MVRAFGLLQRVMQPYFADFGITGTQWGVLRTLERAEKEGMDGLRLTELSKRMFIRPPSTTVVIDRMERAGLVVRGESPTDQRAKQVRLTNKGQQRLKSILAVHADQIAAVMSGLTAQEQADLQVLLGRLSEHLEARLSQTAARGGDSRVRDGANAKVRELVL